MLVYTSDKPGFLRDVGDNRIADRVLDAMQKSGQGSVSDGERRSWEESLLRMKNVLEDRIVPDDAGIAVEYRIPQTSRRVDLIVSGTDDSGQDVCVIIELKQWSDVTATSKEAIVRTWLGGSDRETTHPSYQAWSYASLLQDFNATVQDDAIRLIPCAYLHNCVDRTGVGDERYSDDLERAPVFLKHDPQKLRAFIARYVKAGDLNRTLYRIEHGRIRPSRDLAASLSDLMRGKRDFLMIDDQKLAYETALEVVSLANAGHKQVLIVEGGPGTGKSVVAINLLVELINRGLTGHYVTPNRAPRQVYQARLTGTLKRSRFDNLFKGSGTYAGADDDEMDALVVDEGHRIKERSQYQKAGTNQTRDIIRAAKASIFFIDEDQQVTWQDAGSIAEIQRWAAQAGATVQRMVLQSQFRCNGSDGYLAWLDQLLGIRPTAQDDLEGVPYHFEVVDAPDELQRRVVELDRAGSKARVVAGYCWDWVSKKTPGVADIEFADAGFAMAWNLDEDEGRYLERAHSIDQVGCIHTVQGLEMDYVGVIIGPDLVVRNGEIVTQPAERAKTDRSLRGYKTLFNTDRAEATARADRIIRNTYRTLMSRGMKGCLVYCTDAETQAWFQARAAEAIAAPAISRVHPEGTDGDNAIFLEAPDVTPADNAVPFVEMTAAAGAFADSPVRQSSPIDSQTWVELPESFNARADHFVMRVVGESMNQRIPNGSLCLFRASPGGTREGKIVLVQHRDIQDPDTGSGLTVKRYHSEKAPADDGEGWRHQRIVLACETTTPGYEDIVFESADEAGDLRVLAEYVATVG
ncbi:AAA family ATPase [Spiribacter roseus]|uniref:DNA/RNA helicase domain-containing protein n=1 Tax=Spiribacter roseus TaxID=1855875 RepID=UPI000F71AAA4|nr:AAA family ATPase [Spiribacter roseus]